MTPRLLSLLSAFCLATLPLTAQAEEDKDRLGFSKLAEGESRGCCPDRWTCIVAGADKAMTVVKLSSITSVSKQTYMLEGSQRIVEVTIDTEGNNSIRFYSMSSGSALSAQDRATNSRELVDKYTDAASRFPAKKYPEATHSHNVEFQLSSPKLVNRVYESIMYAWVKNTALNLVIKK